MSLETKPATRGLRAPTFFFLQTTALLSAVGMGLALPVLPFVVAQHVSDPASVARYVGWLAASYSLCAFLAAPVLGALSDAVGRRPVLLLCLLGSAAGYALFGFAHALPLLFLGRIVDGITAGNRGALFAYLGDTTPHEERSRYFGRIGAVSGAGLILGPAIGGLAVKFGGTSAPFYCAAGITFLNVVWGYFFLPESLDARDRVTNMTWGKLNPLSQLAGLFDLKYLRPLLIVGLLFTSGFVALSSTFALLAKDRLGWGADTVSFIFVVIGVTDIVVQGVLLGRLNDALGEARLLALGLSMVLVAFIAIACVAYWPNGTLLMVAFVGFAAGEGLFTASYGGLVSQLAGPSAQGRVQGGVQALQEVATTLVPLIATQLYARVSPGAPFWGAIATTLAAGVAFRAHAGVKREPESAIFPR